MGGLGEDVWVGGREGVYGERGRGGAHYQQWDLIPRNKQVGPLELASTGTC